MENIKNKETVKSVETKDAKKYEIERRFHSFNEWIDNVFNHVQNTKL